MWLREQSLVQGLQGLVELGGRIVLDSRYTQGQSSRLGTWLGRIYRYLIPAVGDHYHWIPAHDSFKVWAPLLFPGDM